MIYDPDRIERLKEQYPPGTRIELTSMDDPYSPVPAGTKGTVRHTRSFVAIRSNRSALRIIGDKSVLTVRAVIPDILLKLNPRVSVSPAIAKYNTEHFRKSVRSDSSNRPK